MNETLKEKWVSIGKGAAIAAGGAAFAAAVQYLGGVNWGDFGPLVAAAASVLINVARKYLESARPAPVKASAGDDQE